MDSAPPQSAEDDDYQAASRAAGSYDTPPPPPVPPKKATKSINWWIVIIVILLLAVAAIYWFLLRSKPATAPAPKTNTQQNSENSSNTPATAETTHYDSSNFNLGFDYPKSWKVVDTAGSGKLTVTSPSIKLNGADGQQTDGQIIMTIRDRTQKLPEFDKGNAAAVLDSEKIAYTKPSQTQRGSTYLSFLNYAGSSSGLDGIYITGDNGYQKGQAIPKIDISKVDPIIDITFTSGGNPLTIGPGSWSDDSFSKPLKDMLKSLSIQ